MGRIGAIALVIIATMGATSCASGDGTGCDDGASCSSDGVVSGSSDPRVGELAAASERWAAAALQHYRLRVESNTMDVSFACTFEVIAGNATLVGGAEPLEGAASDTTISRDRCESVPHTVEALYDEVRRFLGPRAVPTIIEYDTYGVPTTIRSAEGVIDGGVLVATLTP